MVELEVCANSLTSALAAQDGGAVRVELCDNLNEGGTTPSYGQILVARKQLRIKLYTLIRPRTGDFLYTDMEFEIMKTDLQYCTQVGCDGVVIGILEADGSVDVERCTELATIAKKAKLSVTFHRAFDMCANLDRAMEDIIGMGIDRILTSGGKSTAIEGANVIAHLVKQARGRIVIMPGGGINEINAADLVEFTKTTEIHSSARLTVNSKMQFKNDRIIL
ncbi:MAG: copper homeostasis protein CutC, partial [Mucilaginibacter sp.]